MSDRAPKVRTSHHRNKEEAARLQAAVDKRFAAEEIDRLKAEIDRLREQLVKQTEALEAARGEIVVAIAFLGRDAGTSRLDLTLNGVIARLVKADADARIALTDDVSKPSDKGTVLV